MKMRKRFMDYIMCIVKNNDNNIVLQFINNVCFKVTGLNYNFPPK